MGGLCKFLSSAQSADPSSLPQITRFLPVNLSSLRFISSPAFLCRLPFRQVLPPSVFFTAASCPFLLLSLLYILLSLLYVYVFLIKLRWRSQWYIFSKGKAKSLIIFTFNILLLSLSLSLWEAFNYFLNMHLFSLNIRKIHHRFISLQQFVGCVDSKIWSSERELYNEIAIQRGFWWKEMVAKRWWRGE